MYLRKSLDSFFRRLPDAQLENWLNLISHKTTKEHQMMAKLENTFKNY